MPPSSPAQSSLAPLPGVQPPQPGLPRVHEGDSPEAIRDVAQQFESLFLHQVMKSMRATVPEGGLLNGGMGGKVFTDMLDMEYAGIASRSGGVGLADLIARDLGAGEPSMLSAPGSRSLAGLRRYRGQGAAGGLLMPVQGRVSSPFGTRKLADDAAPRLHTGVDIAAPSGAPIHAALAGEVIFAGRRGGYGNAVVVDHGNGVQTLYGHASELLVKAGDHVRRGAPIARVGSTGHSTGPHLHFELKRGGRAVDPSRALGLR